MGRDPKTVAKGKQNENELSNVQPKRGVTKGDKEAQFPGRRITAGAVEKSKQQCNCLSTMSQIVSSMSTMSHILSSMSTMPQIVSSIHLLLKDLRFEHGGTKPEAISPHYVPAAKYP